MMKIIFCSALIILALTLVGAKAGLTAAANQTQAENKQDGETQAALKLKAEQAEALADIKKRIAGHEDEPAEQVFKNIDILNGKKASRLPGMMSALTGLLGVDCSYCHVKNQWASEEKPTKQTARKMFRMIATINKDNFEGRNAVSCWTCHRGNPHPPIQ